MKIGTTEVLECVGCGNTMVELRSSEWDADTWLCVNEPICDARIAMKIAEKHPDWPNATDHWVNAFDCFVLAIQNPGKHQRNGQWAFNVLYMIRPDLADAVRTTERDPFYKDERLPEFMVWVEANW